MGGFLSTAVQVGSKMHELRTQGAPRQEYLQPLQQHIQPRSQPAKPAQPAKPQVPPLNLAGVKRLTYGRGDDAPNNFMLAMIIVAIVFIILLLFLRNSQYPKSEQFLRSEQLVTNSPQILSHENVELREYSQYVPKLQLPYMFF